ncbi:NCK-interacting protein with SH3 domain-like [Stegodyphus dumicola]|uniref:NCK-interacting protein with SH3 domain-like n=1 Tax=Stegodyphus dumicola TaxID=202533 RepID=UPI0015B0B6CE|nr:NCK-interacting protein with SH3 domain-like [Stegodyphus dumicola]
MPGSYVYVARYDSTLKHESVLTFKEGDRFIPVQGCSNNSNWALCVDMTSKIGYVPYTYVEKKQIPSMELIWIIESALAKLHTESVTTNSQLARKVIKELARKRAKLFGSPYEPSEDPLTCDEKGEIQREELRNHSISNSSSTQDITVEASSPVLCTDNVNSTEGRKVENQESKNCEYEAAKANATIVNTTQCSTQTDSVSDINVPDWLIPTLIENVRHKTNLSHENSKAAVGVVLNTFIDAVPQLCHLWCQMKDSLKKSEFTQEDSRNICSEDERKLLDIFKQLWYCKNDEQQRNWPVHEDEDHISSLLVDLNNILLDANPRVTRVIVQRDDYEMVNLLVTYYQMEPRRTLRVKMLHVFLTLCELDLVVVTHIVNSVLPMELARDIQDNFEDQEKVQFSAYLLTVVFSTGEQPPNGTYEFINKKFMHFLFENLEECVKEGEEDMGQNLLSIILAFNLHFQRHQENLVLETLKERKYAQALTGKLVFILNREEDPARILSHDMETPNSVLKFLVDMFTVPSLIDLFYLNDIKVLIDIIVRQLMDLIPGEKKRLLYLTLIQNLLRNSNYAEHMHQIDSLRKCFHSVLAQEVPEKAEVDITLDIVKEFEVWFQEE